MLKAILSAAGKSKTLLFSILFLSLIIFMALFASVIANDHPILVKDNNGLHAPAFVDLFSLTGKKINNAEWSRSELSFIIYPLVTWSPGKSDYQNSNYVAPFDAQYISSENLEKKPLPLRNRHWLGTDLRGTDVLSGIIHGARVSLAAGFISAMLAVIIGLIIGGLAGWLGNKGLYISRAHLILLLIALIPVFHMLFNRDLPFANSALRILILSIAIVALMWKIGTSLQHKKFFNKKIKIPFDYIILRLIEIFTTFPKIILILVMAGFSSPSIGSLIFLLVLTGWADFARLIRGEFLQISTLNYIDAARLSGAGNIRIILKHILPNILAPLLVTFVYAVASYILIEAGLSFLGVGVPSDIVTWGSLLSSGKDNLSAWWLILFPGLVLSLSIASFHRIAEEIRSHYQ